MFKEDGSMFGGHSASKKLGGPEIYAVASREFTAGFPGNMTEKMRSVRLEVPLSEADFCAFRD